MVSPNRTPSKRVHARHRQRSGKSKGRSMSGTSGSDHRVVTAFEHPGEGRKRAKSTPKGRQIEPQALTEIEALLDGLSHQRDLLIDHLHLIQDTYHQISAAHLAALADVMKLSFAEVFETPTFYAHFDIVKE